MLALFLIIVLTTSSSTTIVSQPLKECPCGIIRQTGPVVESVINSSPRAYTQGVVDRIRIVEYPTLEAALAAVDTGEADIFGHPIQESDYALVDSYPHIMRQWAYDTRACVLAINTEVYPLNNVHLRRAMAYAIDKRNISNIAMNSLVDMADFPIPRTDIYSIEESEGGLFYLADPAMARAELGMGGMTDIDGDLMVEAPDGSELVLTVYYPPERRGMNETASMLSEHLRAAGINNTLVSIDFESLQEGIANHTLVYSLALYEMEFPLFDPSWGFKTFHSSRLETYGENPSNFVDSTMNAVILRHNANNRLEDAATKVAEGLRTVRDLCPIVPLFFYRWLSVYSEADFVDWPDERFGGIFSIWSPTVITPRVSGPSTLVVAVLPDFFDNFFVSLNPFRAGQKIDTDWLFRSQFNPYLLVYDTLIATRPDGQHVPRTAISWTVQYSGIAADLKSSQSRPQYYCYDTARWTDGNALDAWDVQFTMELFKNLSLIDRSEIIDSVKVVNDHTPGVTLNDLNMYNFRFFGSVPILPQHIWSGRNVTTWEPTVDEAIGSGPYMFYSFEPGHELVLTINEDYYPTVDTDPPSLIQISLSPADPSPTLNVVVRVTLQDRSPISSVALYWTYFIGKLNSSGSASMYSMYAGYEGAIPARSTASRVSFYVNATDCWGNWAVVATGSYPAQTTDQEDNIMMQLLLPVTGAAVLLTSVIVVLLYRRLGPRGH